MAGQPPGRIFISYSRSDGAEFARQLRALLEQEDLSVWQDLVALEGGEDWWTQIEKALRSKDLQYFDFILYCSAPPRSKALSSSRRSGWRGRRGSRSLP